MVTATLNPQTKSATVVEFDHRGCGRDRVTIAHQFLNIPPYEVELPSHLSLTSAKMALNAWVSKRYPKHVVVA